MNLIITEGTDVSGWNKYWTCGTAFNTWIPASEENYGVDGNRIYYYTDEDGTITINSSEIQAEEMVIPETINGVEITRIKSFSSSWDSLKKIYIPKSIKELGYINGLYLEWIEVDALNETYVSIDGLLYDKGMENLLLCPKGVTEDVEVADGVKTITSGAMNGLRTNSITLPNSIENIEFAAINNCRNIKEITIPDAVLTIDHSNFCWCESLETINLGKNVNNVYGEAFSGNSRLVNINVSEENQNYSSIDGVLYDKSGQQLVKYPCGRTEKEYKVADFVKIIQRYAFYDNANLEKIILPDGLLVDSFSGDAFHYCKNLSEICVSESNENFFTKDGVLFLKYEDEIALCAYPEGKKEKEYYIPGDVSGVWSGAFSCNNYINPNLEKIYILDNIKSFSYFAIHTIWLNNKSIITIVCNKDTYAYQYAVNNRIYYELLDTTSDNISVLLDKDLYDSQITLSTKRVASKNIYKDKKLPEKVDGNEVTLSDIKYKVYDISLVDESGNSIQPKE